MVVLQSLCPLTTSVTSVTLPLRQEAPARITEIVVLQSLCPPTTSVTPVALPLRQEAPARIKEMMEKVKKSSGADHFEKHELQVTYVTYVGYVSM